jgi:hypothetical protein
LYEAEKKPELKGYDLKPFSNEELDSLNQLTSQKKSTEKID